MTPMRTFLLAALALGGAILAAPANAQEGRTLHVQAQLHDTALGPHMVPERIEAHVGDTLVVEVSNQGTTKHNLVFCSGPVAGTTCSQRFAFVPLMDPGQNRTVTFQVTQPGTFEYFCDVPGHRQGGMRGELVVQGEAVKKESPGLAAPAALAALSLLALVLRRR